MATQGYAPIIPHANANGQEWERYNPNLTYEDYLRIDLALLKACDVVYMLNNWKTSRGAKIENRYARLLKKEIIYEEGE